MWKNSVEPASPRRRYNKAHAFYMLGTQGYKHTQSEYVIQGPAENPDDF